MKSLRDVIGTISNGYRGAGIVFICGDEVLMQLRRHPPVWSFVGGGFDRRKDHDLLDTALREFFEETGVSGSFSKRREYGFHVRTSSRNPYIRLDSGVSDGISISISPMSGSLHPMLLPGTVMSIRNIVM